MNHHETVTETATLNGFELCRVIDCDNLAQVLIDRELVWMDEEGVEHLGTQIIAVCRFHVDIP